jgi:hypothetical protein
MTNNPFRLRAIQELARLHSQELEELERRARLSSPELQDRFGRTVSLGDPVLTPLGERGRVRRLDTANRRVLIFLDDEPGKSRFLKAEKVELRRGRPRLDAIVPRPTVELS